jgi:two-component system, cell cycle response regulator DivK
MTARVEARHFQRGCGRHFAAETLVADPGHVVRDRSRGTESNHMTSPVTIPTPAHAPVRVLFVEDDAGARDGYVAYLTSCDYIVMPAETGSQALTLAFSWMPDVIVLDLGLPDLDGWEVARQLKASEQTAAIPIIALTASGLPHERASAMRAGCDRHVSKPCEPADLVVEIRCLSARVV